MVLCGPVQCSLVHRCDCVTNKLSIDWASDWTHSLLYLSYSRGLLPRATGPKDSTLSSRNVASRTRSCTKWSLFGTLENRFVYFGSSSANIGNKQDLQYGEQVRQISRLSKLWNFHLSKFWSGSFNEDRGINFLGPLTERERIGCREEK